MPLLEWLSRHLIVLGLPGLFAVAMLDSAAIPIVGGPEALVILLTWQHPARSLWIVLATARGSTVGCLILHEIGRAGGNLTLSRLSSRRKAWIRGQIQAHAFWALFLCVMIPPPFPTKPLVLVTGVMHTPRTVFLAAVLSGRLLRYAAAAYLSYRFGDQAAHKLQGQCPVILMASAGAVLLYLLVRKLLRSSRPR